MKNKHYDFFMKQENLFDIKQKTQSATLKQKTIERNIIIFDKKFYFLPDVCAINNTKKKGKQS